MFRRKLSKAKITALAGALCMISMSLKEDGALASASSRVSYTWPVPASSQIDRNYSEGYDGIDIISDNENTEVVAARAGTVVIARSTDCEHINNYPDYCCNNGMGNYVKIRHEDGTYAMYSHLKYDSVSVCEGEEVKEGTIIGIMGASGRTTKTCLHFSVAYSESRSINTNPSAMNYTFQTKDDSEQSEGEGKDCELWSVTSKMGVNFRSGAGTSFQVIGQIPYEEKVEVQETVEIGDLRWGKTTYDGETGWFALKYAKKTDYDKDSETVESVNVDPYCDVTLDPNGGQCEYSTYMYGRGGKMGDLPTPTRKGYVFVGWYTKKDEGTAVTKQYEVNEDMTVYAHWRK